MKRFCLTLLLLNLCFTVFAQTNDPQEVTPALLKTIKEEALAESKSYKAALDSTKAFSADFIEFMTDTFVINRVANRMTDVDYSTYGINNAIDESVKAYDKLLNKYYNKLLDRLKGDDKQVLIEAQRKWLAFRDAELHLLGVVIKDEYSGGGTMQSNILGSTYADRIVNRVVELFYLYEGMLK